VTARLATSAVFEPQPFSNLTSFGPRSAGWLRDVQRVDAVVAMIRLAGSIYARTLLHRGSRLRWRDALRRTDTLTG
jgi:hypothetical protein